MRAYATCERFPGYGHQCVASSLYSLSLLALSWSHCDMSFEGLSDEDRHGLLAQGRRMLDTLHERLGHTGHQGPIWPYRTDDAITPHLPYLIERQCIVHCHKPVLTAR